MHPRATVEQARARSAKGPIDRNVAEITGVSLATIRKWHTAKRRASDGRRKWWATAA